jgi:radical SAM superfamily enzyme YgiQ (UPF0313 family)
MQLNVVLISTYEMGRQPFGLASPAAWLRAAGAQVHCCDLAVEPLRDEAVRSADLIAFYVPMHMATRMAVRALERVRQINPAAHLCFFGLYAAANAAYLRHLGVATILGGEFETGLVQLAQRLAASNAARQPAAAQPEPVVFLDRQQFLVPDRRGLPDLAHYAHLALGDGQRLPVGYVEASRGCKHRCRHCPIVPIYNGRFRIVQREVVLEDIRQQVAAGARHITFGDPDFFNGIGHAIPLITALHAEHPDLTYDVTIKIEHLLKHAAHLATLRHTGCLFVTSAVESFDDAILAIFEKQHSTQDFETVLQLCRNAGLVLAPTFVAFTPWTTIAGYRSFLSQIARLELVDQVAPVQYAIRLLIPPGSRLLERDDVRGMAETLDEAKLSYVWRNRDPRVDQLQCDLERLIQISMAQNASRRTIFQRIWERAYHTTTSSSHQIATPELSGPLRFVPYLTEPWYC